MDDLTATTTVNDLRKWLSAYGNVAEVNVSTDRGSGRSRVAGAARGKMGWEAVLRLSAEWGGAGPV